MPAFVAVNERDVTGLPGAGKSLVKGVRRWNCEKCGSPIAATFDYLEGQVYLPLGILNEAERLRPEVHCHFDNALDWLCLDDGLPREHASARAVLRKT